MTEKDIQIEMDRIMTQAASIKEVADANTEKIQQLINEARDASMAGDNEKYWACTNEALSRLKQSELYCKMLERTSEDCRRLLVTAYGPVGGMMYDAIIRKQQEEMGS